MREHETVPRAHDAFAARQEVEGRTAELVGRRIAAVEYWDIHNYGDEPRTWDYGDWHHAVMGVELVTDAGPRSVLWTDTFYPYGVEVFADPIGMHLRLGPEGPQGWPAGDHPLWQARARISELRRRARSGSTWSCGRAPIPSELSSRPWRVMTRLSRFGSTSPRGLSGSSQPCLTTRTRRGFRAR